MSPHGIWNNCFQYERTLKLSSDRAKENAKAIFSLIFSLLVVWSFSLLVPLSLDVKRPLHGTHNGEVFGFRRLPQPLCIQHTKIFRPKNTKKDAKYFVYKTSDFNAADRHKRFLFSTGFVVLCCVLCSIWR